MMTLDLEEVKMLMLSTQQTLLENEQQIRELEVEKEGLEVWHQTEATRVEEYFHMVLERLNTAKDSLLAQLATEVGQLSMHLVRKEQDMYTTYMGLFQELARIQEVLASGESSGFSLESCKERVSNLQPCTSVNQIIYPHFHPSSNLAKLRRADLGFLQIAEYLPEHFSLQLISPVSSLEVGTKAVCSVVTTTQFTDAIQANIKFSIKNKLSNDQVPFCREDCLVSTDKKSFQIAFLLLQPGVYTITVLLYDQPIQDSPLSVHVPPTTAPTALSGSMSPFSPTWTQVRQQLEQFNLDQQQRELLDHIPTEDQLNQQCFYHVNGLDDEGHLMLPHLCQEGLSPSTKEQHPASSTPHTTPQSLAPGSRRSDVLFPNFDSSPVNQNSNPDAISASPIEVDGVTKITNMMENSKCVEEEVKNKDKCEEKRIQEVDGSEISELQNKNCKGRSDLTKDSIFTKKTSSTSLPSLLSQDVRMLPEYSAQWNFPNHRASLYPFRPPFPTRHNNTTPRPSWCTSVRPSAPLEKVNFVTLFSRLKYNVSNATMCLEAPHQRHHHQASVDKPIGICLLGDKCVVVASTFEHKVKMFTGCGQFLREVQAGPGGQRFWRPSDMVALSKGGFAVRDAAAIRFYDNKGKFQRILDSFYMNRCYGLAEDEEGHLITINENKDEQDEAKQLGTKPGNTDLLYFCLSSGELIKRIELSDVILNKKMSKCRFLTWGQGNLIIADLGLDRVYILNPVTKGVTMFGESGSGPGCFSDPAGLAVDCEGNILVADSKNHRICLHDKVGKFISEVTLKPSVRRPSGLLLDQDNGDIYLLNMQGGLSVVRYSLQ